VVENIQKKKMKIKMLVFAYLLLGVLGISSCMKAVEEPEHKNKGKKVLYLNLDKSEYMIEEGFNIHRNTEGEIFGYTSDQKHPSILRSGVNGAEMQSIYIGYNPAENNRLSAGYLWITQKKVGGEYVLTNITMNLYAFTEKFNRFVTIADNISDLKVEIERLDEKKKIISLFVSGVYFNDYDTLQKGNFYFYLDSKYQNY
jgi:hypothetical protein